EVLLKWFVFVKSRLMELEVRPLPTVSDPLLAWALGRPPEPDDLPRIAEALDHSGVPESLYTSVAALVLRRWYYFGSRVQPNRRGWQRLALRWPKGVARALNLSNSPGRDEVSEEMGNAAREAVIGYAQLQASITKYTTRSGADSVNGETGLIARWLWHWSVRAFKGTPL